MNLNPYHGQSLTRTIYRLMGFSTTNVSFPSSFTLPWSRKGCTQDLSQIELLCLEKARLRHKKNWRQIKNLSYISHQWSFSVSAAEAAAQLRSPPLIAATPGVRPQPQRARYDVASPVNITPRHTLPGQYMAVYIQIHGLSEARCSKSAVRDWSTNIFVGVHICGRTFDPREVHDKALKACSNRSNWLVI